MESWSMTGATLPHLLRVRRKKSRQEGAREDSRSRRACVAQFAGVVVAQFFDDRGNLRWRGIACGDVVARYRLAAIVLAAAGEIRLVRHSFGHLAARPSRHGTRGRAERANAGGKPGAGWRG